MSDQNLANLSKKFQDFAVLECRGSSPLYETLSHGISQDPDLLRIAAESKPGQPVPNLFLAAVHYLLLKGVDHLLASFYQDLSAYDAEVDADPIVAFRDFCLSNAEALAEIISQRIVQTNVVERCGLLLPAFDMVARVNEGNGLSLIEIGASAGLNLFWDRYGYSYVNGQRHGDADSPLQIELTLRGDSRPTIAAKEYRIADRAGIDLNPIDVRDEDAVTWLRALVWPENDVRLRRMNSAIELVRADPPTLLAGNALDLLPDVLGSVSPGSVPCVYHTHTVNQFSREDRDELDSILSGFGKRRDLYWISSEYRPRGDSGLSVDEEGQRRPTLEMTSFVGGVRSTNTLARCDHHGRWLEWLHSED